MDCQTFDSSLMDALYDELDAETSTALDEHAAGCESCAKRAAALRKTRELVGPALEASLPDDFEARILAAADVARDGSTDAERPAVAAPDSASSERVGEVISLVNREKRGSVVSFLSRPQFAIAATFLLVLGAATLFINTSAKRAAPPMAAAEVAASVAREGPAAPSVAAAATASAMAYAPPPVAATPVGQVAKNEWDEALGGLDAPAAKTEASGPSASGNGALARADKGASKRGHDPAFDSARALFDSGRYAEALPRFEALAATNPEAELYAARCIANTKGCGAAIARYDSAARRTAGTESGSRAALEAARCTNQSGQSAAARSRYQGLTHDVYVSAEANAELAALDAPKAAAPAKPATRPAATATAAPPTTRARPPVKTTE
jgi:hypothetical protein